MTVCRNDDVNGSPLFDPRRLRPEQELAGAVLDGVVTDLRHDPYCARYTLAVAWVHGRFDCGCPYEADFDLERVADVLNQDAGHLRALLMSELHESSTSALQRWVATE